MEFQMEKLVVLDLHHSKLQHVWNKTPFLESLKILDLSYSEWLERTPNFVGLPNLESLILKGCVRLVEVCESIGNLEMLESLDLSDCITLQKLPRNIGRLGSLRNLVICGCNISEFPSEMRNMKSLKVLNDAGYVINPLREVKWWQAMVLSMVPAPKKGPQTLLASLPRSLQHLNLSGCNLSDESFPENLGDLPVLSNLNLSQNMFRRLPNWIKRLNGLRKLDIGACDWLQSLDLTGLPNKMYYIDAGFCNSLENITSLDGSVLVGLEGSYKLHRITDDSKNESEDIGDLQIIRSLGIIKEKMVSTPFEPLVCYEFGISSIYASKKTTLLLINNMTKGSSISFVVPMLSTRRIHHLNVCCTFWGRKSENNPTLHHQFNKRMNCISVKIENRTKDLTWIYSPMSFVIYYGIDCGWVSQWKFGNQIKAGDEITISFCAEGEYKIQECGFKIVYGNDKEKE